jgi:hypothetical protein
MEKGTAIVRDEDVRRLRALEMIQMRMVGKTVAEVAMTFNCDTDTVWRTIKWAGKNGIIDTAESTILDTLVPKALKVYEAALDNGDTFAAKHIIDKLSEMAERADRRRDKGEDRMLEVWMKEREEKKRRANQGRTTKSDADADEDGPCNVIDAQVLPAEDGQPDGEDSSDGPVGGESPFIQASTLLAGASECLRENSTTSCTTTLDNSGTSPKADGTSTSSSKQRKTRKAKPSTKDSAETTTPQ